MTSKVTVGGYGNSLMATLAKQRLEQEGIEATVFRQSRYRAMGGFGWVVQVASEDAARAEALLKDEGEGPDLDEYVDPTDKGYRRCPQCGSVNVLRAPLSGRQKAIAVATLGFGYLFLTKHFACRKCKHVWFSK